MTCPLATTAALRERDLGYRIDQLEAALALIAQGLPMTDPLAVARDALSKPIAPKPACGNCSRATGYRFSATGRPSKVHVRCTRNNRLRPGIEVRHVADHCNRHLTATDGART